jgi:hypothetical protein
METRTLERRMLRHYAAADPDNGGRSWYRESRKQARRIARETGVTASVAAGVIAAFSPRQQWKTNVRMAEDACRTGTSSSGLGQSRRAAQRILDGERPLDVLNGPKVRAFYRAIMGDESAAVVDVWMLRAMGLGEAIAPKDYPTAALAIERAARKTEVTTATFQAIVWTHVRGRAA